jgi:hypothetical protein
MHFEPESGSAGVRPRRRLWGHLLVAVCFAVLIFSSAKSLCSVQATQEVVDEVKKTFQTVVSALMNEDATAAKACIAIPTEADEPVVDAMIQNALAMHRLGKAAEARFGVEAKRLRHQGVIFDDDVRQQAAQMAAGTVNMGSASEAFLQTPDRHGMKSFKKTGSGWKIDDVRFASDEERDKQRTSLLAEAQMMREFASQIEQGSFKNAEHAEAAYQLKRNSGRGVRTAAATTQPRVKERSATQPDH